MYQMYHSPSYDIKLNSYVSYSSVVDGHHVAALEIEFINCN